jgi:release factor glutamine methyltransferase
MKIKEALKWAVTQFQVHNICDTPLLDASLLLSHETHLSREQLYTHDNDELSEKQAKLFKESVASRLEHIPIAYLTGVREFYGRDFFITSDVLIPRGDTETLVEKAISFLKESNQEMSILDLCTGSGCIGITLSLEIAHAKVTLSDISVAALEVAKTNRDRLQAPITEIVQSDLFEAFDDRLFSCIVSNPPYIAPDWYQSLSKDVLSEPKLALLCDSIDGLSIIKSIITLSTSHLHKNGYLMIECDYRQIEEVMNIFNKNRFSEVAYHEDLGMKRRVVSGRYRCTKS